MRTILVPLDGSPFSEYALPTATRLAERTGAELLLAHVHTLLIPAMQMVGAPTFDPVQDQLLRDSEQKYLDQTAARMQAIWNGAINTVLLDAPIDQALADCAQMRSVDLMVMSTHGRGGLQRAWLGSTADRLIRRSPVPILLIRPHEGPVTHDEPITIRHILIPLDGSELAEQAIAPAFAIGNATDAHYTFVRVIEPIYRSQVLTEPAQHIDVMTMSDDWLEAETYLKAIAAPFEASGKRVTVKVITGQPAPAILEYACEHEIDLIAMSTHGRSGIARLILGSVADKLVRSVSIPLLVHHPQELAV